jgi:TetR/AcrR family transcriptional regulator, transcriptional repressor for nem operon
MTDSGALIADEPRPGKRQRLVAAASQLVHQQGIERTTLAEIAKAADVPAGNVYYYFKTKDEVIAAVIESHVRQTKAALALIEKRHQSPKDRLKALVAEFISQSEVIARYGCPLGTLCSEIDKRAPDPIVPVGELMRVPIEWAEEQFSSLGREDARDLAIDLMAAYEGSALLANTMHDPDVLTGAAHRLDRWIDAL